MSFRLLEEVRHISGDKYEVIWPEWRIKSLQYFLERYGQKPGTLIFEKATKVFLKPFFN